jgi:hypothetical protein
MAWQLRVTSRRAGGPPFVVLTQWEQRVAVRCRGSHIFPRRRVTDHAD